jgi:cytochrome c-type biogenesis protein
MTFLVISFLAGALTVLAPCILPLLPVVIGSSAAARSKFTPYIVVGSLAVSIILFTFILKASTALITIPPEVWSIISGGILIGFGATLVFPGLWEKIPGLAKLSANSNKLVGTGYKKKSIWGDVLVGAALGPVFSTCSPTYFVILASVLPASFLLGTTYLLAYVAGLSIVLLLLAVLGERLASRLGTFADPKGLFKRIIGFLFVILGIMIITGFEKKIETAILNSGYFDVTKIEQGFLQNSTAGGSSLTPDGIIATSSLAIPSTIVATGTAVNTGASGTSATGTIGASKDSLKPNTTVNTPTPSAPVSAASQSVLATKSVKYPKAPELVSPDGYLNTGGLPVTLAQYRGKKVVLVDFWTYSCINCQRTTPYLNAWYDTYEKDGFVIIGVHTPEFAFEHVQANVAAAIQKEGIRYPVALDNEYATWNAYKNQFWPRKYLVDIDGYIVYDHIGEGAYTETEAAIRTALKERTDRLGSPVTLGATTSVNGSGTVHTGTPETYFGAAQNKYLANGTPNSVGVQTLTLPTTFPLNSLFLGGTWDFKGENANPSAGAKVVYTYNAKEVYVVASADTKTGIDV